MKLRYETRQLSTLELVRMVQRGHLIPSGEVGGPAWTTSQRVQLWQSVEHRWPIGMLLAWNPAEYYWRRWYLLDGHRRVATLGELVAEQVDLVRDLRSAEPTYLPAAAATSGGVYLPVNAMLMTARLLPAISDICEDALDVADNAVAAIANTPFEVTTVTGGTASEVATLCSRLIPGRVQPAVLDQILAQDAAAPYHPQT
jgi:hypothetical protein